MVKYNIPKEKKKAYKLNPKRIKLLSANGGIVRIKIKKNMVKIQTRGIKWSRW